MVVALWGAARVTTDQGPDELLTCREVAARFRVNPKTVSRWERAGKLRAIRTLGGHRRFYRSDIERTIARAAADD